VIDPAFGSTEAIFREATKQDLHIEKILLTHSHWDHIADVHLLKAKTGAPIYIHPLDAPNLEEPGRDRVPSILSIPGVKPDFLLHEGDVIHVGHLKIEVIHCPGHTPGGVSYYIPSEKTLISGDTLFKGAMGSLSLPTSEPKKMGPTLKKLGHLPKDVRVIPGHGPDTTIEDEHWILER
jgi:hydroxyacylglutathione hydrolase